MVSVHGWPCPCFPFPWPSRFLRGNTIRFALGGPFYFFPRSPCAAKPCFFAIPPRPIVDFFVVVKEVFEGTPSFFLVFRYRCCLLTNRSIIFSRAVLFRFLLVVPPLSPSPFFPSVASRSPITEFSVFRVRTLFVCLPPIGLLVVLQKSLIGTLVLSQHLHLTPPSPPDFVQGDGYKSIVDVPKSLDSGVSLRRAHLLRVSEALFSSVGVSSRLVLVALSRCRLHETSLQTSFSSSVGRSLFF